MDDRSKGIYKKYNVTRTDGSSAPGGKHENCTYFVLTDIREKGSVMDATKIRGGS